MENLSVLTGKYGDEGDQLLFKILNSGDYLKKTNSDDYDKGSGHLLPKIAEKGLRYDLTVPFARYVVMNQHEISFPFKRYQVQPVWRADRPQKGRYREFYQCDADIIGTKSLWNEVELTLLIHDVFAALRLEDYEVKINHREILYSIAEITGLKGKEIPFCVALDKLDKIGEERVIEEVEELGGDKKTIQKILELIISNKKDSIATLHSLKEICGENEGFRQVLNYYDSLKHLEDKNNRQFKVSLDFSLARGLTYYTGMIYEVKPTTVKMGSICGGGRYDDLTGVFGLGGVSGIGISFGLDRIYDVLEELNLFPTDTQESIQVLFVHFDETSFKHCISLIEKLRSQGISSELYPESVKIKKQFNYANKINVPHVVTVGSEEIKTGKYAFKNMKSGEQEKLSIDEIILKFRT